MLRKANNLEANDWYYFTASLAGQFREESDIRMWNIRASYFRQEAGESIIDYGLRFDTEIVEMYPLPEPMSDLQRTKVYCVGL